MAPFRRFSLNAWYACYGRMAHYKIRKRLAKPCCHRRGFFPIDVKPIDRIQHFAAAVPIELSEQRDDLFDDGVGFRGWLRLGVVRLKVVFGLGFLSPTDRQRSLGAASLFRGSGQPAPGAARTFALIMAQGGGRSWESLRTLGPNARIRYATWMRRLGHTEAPHLRRFYLSLRQGYGPAVS